LEILFSLVTHSESDDFLAWDSRKLGAKTAGRLVKRLKKSGFRVGMAFQKTERGAIGAPIRKPRDGTGPIIGWVGPIAMDRGWNLGGFGACLERFGRDLSYFELFFFFSNQICR
jgi:hypothetical protein